MNCDKLSYATKHIITNSADANFIHQCTIGGLLFASFKMGIVPALTKTSGFLNPSSIKLAI
jgi:hypothetical protein